VEQWQSTGPIPSDATAISQTSRQSSAAMIAKALLDDHTIELWSGDRMVNRLSHVK
jgi:hypothetical protein